MKIQKIQTVFNTTKRLINAKLKSSKNTSKTVLPIVSTPVLACLLQNESEAKKSLVEDSINGRAILPNRRDNINFISELEKKRVISPQKPWDAPALNNGIATDSYYNAKVEEIKKSTLLSDYDKESQLKEFARLNNRTYDPNFKGMDNFNTDFDTELSSIDSELATLDAEHARLAAGSVSAQEAIESGLLDEVGVSDFLSEITDHPGIVVATGVAAELLPGTKFLKPAKDFLEGDYAKAGIGAATRLGEMALGPLKLLWAGGTGLLGGVMSMFHPEDKELGFWKCFKYASESWAKGRENLENIFIDRETSGEKKSRLKREAKEKYDKKIREVEVKKEQLKRKQFEMQEQVRELEKQRKHEEFALKQTEKVSRPLGFFEQQRIKNQKRQRLSNLRQQFKKIIADYQALCPHPQIQRYRNWEQWDYPKLNESYKELRQYVNKLKCKKKK